jgi:hypothetical protein
VFLHLGAITLLDDTAKLARLDRHGRDRRTIVVASLPALLVIPPWILSAPPQCA